MNMEISDFNINGYLSEEIEEWTKTQSFSNDEFFNLSVKINQFAQKVLYELEIHKEDPQELLISTLYIRVLPIYQGAILLITKGMIIEAKILARSLLEILYRIGAISKSMEIAIDFIRQDHLAQKKVINKINSLSDEIKGSLELSELSAKYTELQNEIAAMGIKEHGTQWFANKAGLMDSYNTAYSSFSNPVHSNVRELESYLVLDENGKVISFRYGPTSEHRNEVLLTLHESMLHIIHFLGSTFDLEMAEDFESLQNASNKLVDKYFRKAT